MDSCCGGGIRTRDIEHMKLSCYHCTTPQDFDAKVEQAILSNKSLQTLQRFGYLEVLLQLCRRKLIGNYKIDMQPIRLTHKSLLPERPFGRTDAMYIGLMIL